MNLSTQVGKVAFQTPLILASGFITETPSFFLSARLHGCAGMVTRSLKAIVPSDRVRVPSPRYAVFEQTSMLNCEWGSENPWRTWSTEGVDQVRHTGCPLIVSLSGRDIESCRFLIDEFDRKGVDGYEINVSCSHSGALHGNLNVDLLHLERLMSAIRKITSTPIWVKLSYSTLLLSMAKTAQDLGADAIVCTNSIGPGMLIDTKTAKPKVGISGGAGGLTGRAIFPIALWCVSQLSQALTIPVVGCGGIFTADDVVQMLMAGASAVQLYTAPSLRGPEIFAQISAGLQEFFTQNVGYLSIRALVGAAKENMREHQFSSPRPVVIKERCTGCGFCVFACAFKAIEVSSKSGSAMINDLCNSCNACAGVCASGAIRASF